MISKHFDIRELVPPEIHSVRGDNSWELLDGRLIFMLDDLWDNVGPFVVNDWHKGGTYKESGLRSSGTSTGAKYSQHKFGRAVDAKFKNKTPQEAHAFILANPDKFPYVTTLEAIGATPTWVHCDCRNHNSPGIKVVAP